MQTNSPLLEQYAKLSQFEQTLLQFLSITYEPAHATLIVNCLRKLDLVNPRGNKPTAANLTHYFNKFEELGLLTKEKQVVEGIVEILMVLLTFSPKPFRTKLLFLTITGSGQRAVGEECAKCA